MTVSDIQDIILTRLVRYEGGARRDWRAALGAIRLHDVRTHPHCNWSAAPSGSHRENDAIERLLDDLRLSHPIITRG